MQGVFQQVEGVISATSGYTGGSYANPRYGMVSTGTTGHAEVVKIVYDPSKVTLPGVHRPSSNASQPSQNHPCSAPCRPKTPDHLAEQSLAGNSQSRYLQSAGRSFQQSNRLNCYVD